MLAAIIFDLDDTLIVEGEKARTSLARALAAAGARADDVDRALEAIRVIWRASPDYAYCQTLGIASWECLWATFEGCHPSLERLKGWIPTYRRLAWEAALAALDADAAHAPAAEECFIASQRQGHELIETAAAAVRSVPGVKRGLLTNGPPDIQRLKIAQSGLGDAFDAVTISGVIGAGKPDPACFRHVLGELQVAPEDAVMVGDNWRRDVEGATALGMRAVWITMGRPLPAELDGVTAVAQLEPSALASL